MCCAEKVQILGQLSKCLNVYEAPSSLCSKTYAFLALDWKLMLKLRPNELQSEG